MSGRTGRSLTDLKAGKPSTRVSFGLTGYTVYPCCWNPRTALLPNLLRSFEAPMTATVFTVQSPSGAESVQPHHLLQRLEKGDQVGKFLPAQLLVQPFRHDRDCARPHGKNLRARQTFLHARSLHQLDALRCLAFQNARMLLPIARLHDHWLVGPHETRPGIYDGFKKVALRPYTADAREVRPDLPSEITNRVARNACRAGAVEDGLTAPMIAAQDRPLEVLEARLLLRQIDI